MNRPENILVFLLLAALGAFALLTTREKPWAREVSVFSEVFSLARSEYVEDKPAPKLLAGALNGMLHTLDPYSQFLDAAAYQDLKIGNEGRFGGVGVELTLKDGLLHVISPLDGSPAAAADVRPGDSILKIDGEPTRDMTLTDAAHLLRGEPGTVVTLTLTHEGENHLLDIPVTRAIVRVTTIKGAKMLEGSIGTIRLSAFRKESAHDLRKAIQSLEAQGMKKLILDLRNNPGGLLESALEVSEIFIPYGQTIVKTQGRKQSKNSERISRSKDVHAFSPLLLLVNKGSASSSEILAGAIQDHKLGLLVGSKTYGKGCIQTLTPLSDGTAVRITTSRYYTPKGFLIHERGLVPDVVVTDADEKDDKDEVFARALELARS